MRDEEKLNKQDDFDITPEKTDDFDVQTEETAQGEATLTNENSMEALNEKMEQFNQKLNDIQEQHVDEIEELNEQMKEVQEELEDNKKAKKNWRLVSLIELIIIIILLLKGCAGDPSMQGVWWVDNNKTPLAEEDFPEIEDDEYIEWEQIFAEEAETNRIDIPVISDFTVSKSSPYKTLYNPASNAGKYYLQYTFTINGQDEPFYQSKLVEGGYKFSVDFGSLLDLGEYTVTIKTSTYEYETYEPKSGDAHEINITVVP